MEIAYCKIFPPIGIARVGDSAETEELKGWFVDPASGEELPEDFRYKDESGRVKRQAALFHIYGFDRNGRFVRELTSKDAEISWEVELANKKSAWFDFRGAKIALEAFEHPTSKNLRKRNAHIEAESERATLSILGGKVQVPGRQANQLGSDADAPPQSYSFIGRFKGKKEVYLGEARLDSKGRLIVLGGHGESEALSASGEPKGETSWILNYANNDDWHDDVSDGPVRARVKLRDAKGKELKVRSCAWVVVAPPDFAPDVENLVTLFDVMEEVAFYNPALQVNAKELPAPRSPDDVFYERDIRPVLARMLGYAWVSESALRGHGAGKEGYFDLNAIELSIPPSELPADKVDAANALRQSIFRVIRAPIYTLPLHKGVDEVRKARGVAQASSAFMPVLSGDEGTTEAGDPNTWLSVTHLQYARLQRWSEGKFKSKVNEDKNPPLKITRRVLDRCSGGAFFPGIEMTVIARHPKLYGEAYRIDPQYQAGDTTKFMAVPWQADFYECNSNWWPAQRPDDVVPEAQFRRLVDEFAEELVEDPKRLGGILHNRSSWTRGLGRVQRPTVKFLSTRLFPDAAELGADNLKAYIVAVSTGPLADFALLTTPIERLASDASSEFAERLMSPWRLQFLVQEQFDLFASAFLHLVVPAPEEVLREKDMRELGFRVAVLHELKRSWRATISSAPTMAAKLLQVYALRLREHVQGTILGIVKHSQEYLVATQEPNNRQISSFIDGARNAPPSDSRDAAGGHPGEIEYESPLFYKYQFYALRDALLTKARTFHMDQVGDMEMVDAWSQHGFVRRIRSTARFKNLPPVEVEALVETERDEYDGLSFREYFYILMNVDSYPSFAPFARKIAQEILETTRVQLIEKFGVDEDRGHPEIFVDYSPVALAAKLEEIYENQRKQSVIQKPWRSPGNRKSAIDALINNAPFNQADGAWLRGVAQAGPTDAVRAMLFEIWSDEIGNGDPALNHSNLYTSLLSSVDVRLPDVQSREYAYSPAFQESDFIAPVYELAISTHTDEFFPEILGMTLFLEWEVLSLVPAVKLYDYLGIDSQFYRMHVGIDNATEGHGAKARRAVEVYLDGVRRESGEDEVQSHWKRIWNGFVSFAAPEIGYFTDDLRQVAATPEERLLEVIRRKRPYGNRNHGAKQIGPHRINQLFDDPALFLTELANSPWIVAGSPEQSRLLTYLTTYDGPMYKIFDKEDLDTWRAWIVWLGREGDTGAPKRYLSKGESMLGLVQELRAAAQGAHGHRIYGPRSSHPDRAGDRKIVDLFNEPDLNVLLRELRNPANGWVVPGRADDSPLIVDLARASRPMGAALDARYRAIGGQIGRRVLLRWIDAGCPIPGEPQTFEPAPGPTSAIGVQLIVQKYGKGAVH